MSKQIIRILIFNIIILCTSSAYSKEIKMTTEHFYIEIVLSQLQADIYINDILLFPKNDENGLSTTHPISQWLSSGKNTVNITLYALKGQKLAAGSLEIKIYLHDNAHDFPTPKTILAELNIPQGNPTDLSKISKSLSFDFDYQTPTTLWSKAEKINTITQSEKKEIISIIENFKSAFLDSTRINEAIAFQNFKIEEDALAGGHTPERLKEVAKETTQWVHTMPNLKGEELNLKNANFTVCGHDRILLITKINGNHAVHIESEDNIIEVPIYMSKINNQWTIVR